MDGSVNLSNSQIEVDYDELEQILSSLADKKRTISEASGALRSAIKAVIDDHGWHKGALATIRRIDDMSETARADFLRSFAPLYEAMQEYKWRDELDDLFDGEGEGGEE